MPSGPITRSFSSMRHSTPNPPKMFKHLQCEAHRTRSAVKVQHGSSQARSPAALYPPEASRKSDKIVPSLRSPLDLEFSMVFLSGLQREAHRTRSAVEVQHGSSPQAFNAKPTGPDQPLRFSMALPLRPYLPCRFIHQRLQPNRIVNAKLTGSDQPLRFGMALPLRPSM